MEARHKDGNHANNIIENLEWNTPPVNGQDRIIHGTQNKGENHYKRILTAKDVKEIREFFSVSRRFGDKTKIAKKYGIARTTLSSVIHNQSWKD